MISVLVLHLNHQLQSSHSSPSSYNICTQHRPSTRLRQLPHPDPTQLENLGVHGVLMSASTRLHIAPSLYPVAKRQDFSKYHSTSTFGVKVFHPAAHVRVHARLPPKSLLHATAHRSFKQHLPFSPEMASFSDPIVSRLFQVIHIASTFSLVASVIASGICPKTKKKKFHVPSTLPVFELHPCQLSLAFALLSCINPSSI